MGEDVPGRMCRRGVDGKGWKWAGRRRSLVGEMLPSWEDGLLGAACALCNIQYVCAASLIPGDGDAFIE